MSMPFASQVSHAITTPRVFVFVICFCMKGAIVARGREGGKMERDIGEQGGTPRTDRETIPKAFTEARPAELLLPLLVPGLLAAAVVETHSAMRVKADEEDAGANQDGDAADNVVGTVRVVCCCSWTDTMTDAQGQWPVGPTTTTTKRPSTTLATWNLVTQQTTRTRQFQSFQKNKAGGGAMMLVDVLLLLQWLPLLQTTRSLLLHYLHRYRCTLQGRH